MKCCRLGCRLVGLVLKNLDNLLTLILVLFSPACETDQPVVNGPRAHGARWLLCKPGVCRGPASRVPADS